MWCLGARNFYPVAIESECFQKPESDACRKMHFGMILRISVSAGARLSYCSPWAGKIPEFLQKFSEHRSVFDIQEDTKGSNNPWTRCKPNVQKSIKKHHETLVFQCSRMPCRPRTICPTPPKNTTPPHLLLGEANREAQQRCVTSINIPNRRRLPILLGTHNWGDNNQHLKHISKQACKSHWPSRTSLAGAAPTTESPCSAALVEAPQ